MNFRLWGSLLLLSYMGLFPIFGGNVAANEVRATSVELQETATSNKKHTSKPDDVRTSRKGTFTEMIKDKFTRKKRALRNLNTTNTTITDPLVKACENVNPVNTIPLKCYHCTSNTRLEREPICDHNLWRYLKHSEKARLREICNLDAKFCVKVVQQKLGERKTTRGCFGTQIPGPNGTMIEARNGCALYHRSGYRTTLCLCNTDYCNTAVKKINVNPTYSSLLIAAVGYLINYSVHH